MSNTIRTQTAAPRTQPQAPQEGFFGKVGRVLKETFSTPQVPVQKAKTADTYITGQPLSRGLQFRLDRQIAGRGDGNRQDANTSKDAESIAWLSAVSRTGRLDIEG